MDEKLIEKINDYLEKYVFCVETAKEYHKVKIDHRALPFIEEIEYKDYFGKICYEDTNLNCIFEDWNDLLEHIKKEIKQIKKENNIKKLAKKSLEKWQKKHSVIFSNCAFCDDAVEKLYNLNTEEFENAESCDFCLCPPVLCSSHGQKGLVSDYIIQDNIYVGDIPTSELSLMQDGLMEIVEKGELSKKMIKKIKKYEEKLR